MLERYIDAVTQKHTGTANPDFCDGRIAYIMHVTDKTALELLGAAIASKQAKN